MRTIIAAAALLLTFAVPAAADKRSTPEEAQGMVAHAVNPTLLGVKYSAFVDANGQRFGEAMHAKATADGAWVNYRFKNPSTGKIENKSSWAVLHDGWIFGVGIYKP